MLNPINMICVHLNHYLKTTTSCVTHVYMHIQLYMYLKQQESQCLRNTGMKCTSSSCFFRIYSPRIWQSSKELKRGCNRQDCNGGSYWCSFSFADTSWRSARGCTENKTNSCIKEQIPEPALVYWKQLRANPRLEEQDKCPIWPQLTFLCHMESLHWEAGEISISKTSGLNCARWMMRICNTTCNTYLRTKEFAFVASQ